MKNLLFVFFILTSLSVFSQKRERLDSLLRTEKNITSDTNGTKHLIKIAKQFKKINTDSSYIYLDKAFQLARQLNSNLFVLKVYYEKIGLIKNEGDLRKLADTILFARQLALDNNNPVFLARFNLDLGVAYRKMGNYDKSVRYLLDALELSLKNNYKSDIYNSYNSLANTYSQAGVVKKSGIDLKRALEYYEKAFSTADKDNKQVSGMILNNLGVTYYNLGQVNKDSTATKKAIDYYQQSLKLRLETKDSTAIASSYNNLGSAYHDLCDNYKKYNYLETALSNYERAVKIDSITRSPESYTNLSNYAIHLALMGRVQKNNKLLEKAIKLLRQSLAISKNNNDNYTAMVNTEGIAISFEELGRFDSSTYYMHKFVALKDTLLTEENKHVAEELAAKYESDLKDSENNNLKQQAELREEVISKKSNTIKLMIVASVIMLGLIVIVFISRQKINKSRELIKKQQSETERQKLLVEAKQKEILDSINYSKRLQDAAIPSLDYFKSLLPQSFIFYKPKDIVAGDFYWIHSIAGRQAAGVSQSRLILVAAADCTGHGVPGALVSIVCLNALNRCVDEFGLHKPSDILDKATEIIQQSFRQSENDVKDGMDIVLCLLDLNNFKGYFAGANNPVWILSDTGVKEIKGDNQPVGQQHLPKPFTSHVFSIAKGDTILLATDGYSDQFGGPSGKKLKTKKFKEIFPELNKMQMPEAHLRVETFFDDWKGKLEQVDDVLVIGIRV